MEHGNVSPGMHGSRLGMWIRRSMIWAGLIAIVVFAAGEWPGEFWPQTRSAWAAGSTGGPGCGQGQLIARPDVAGVYAGGSAVNIPVLANDGVAGPAAPVSPLAPHGVQPKDAVAAPQTVPGGGSGVKVIGATQPAQGSVAWTAEGLVLYTPGAEFTGSDHFTYTIQDACGRTATGKVVVVVFSADMGATPGLIGGPANPGDIQVLPLPFGGVLHIPPGLFQGKPGAGPIQFVLLDPEARADMPRPGLHFANLAFRLTQFENIDPVENPSFTEPILLEVTLDPSLAGGANLPQLFYWNEATQRWQEDGIVRISYNPATGVAVFAIYHLTEFALFAGPPAPGLYVPTLMGN